MAMQTHEWEDFKAMLTARHEDLLRVIADSESVVQDQLRGEADDGTRIDFNHPADAATGDTDYEKELTLLRQQQGELALVDAALNRIRQGTFGTCLDCGTEIKLERLTAVPYAKFCLDCQQQDAGAKMPGNFQPSATI